MGLVPIGLLGDLLDRGSDGGALGRVDGEIWSTEGNAWSDLFPFLDLLFGRDGRSGLWRGRCD